MLYAAQKYELFSNKPAFAALINACASKAKESGRLRQGKGGTMLREVIGQNRASFSSTIARS